MFSPAGRVRTCECFHLAGILITEGNLRQELLETLAAGKYSILLSRVVTLQAPIFQVLAFDAESIISDGARPPGYAISLISNINKRPVVFLCRSSGGERLRGYPLSRMHQL